MAAVLTACTVLGIALPWFHFLRTDEFAAGVSVLLEDRALAFHRHDPVTPVVRLMLTVGEPNPAMRTVPLRLTAQFYDSGLEEQPSFVDQLGRSVVDRSTHTVKPAYADASFEVVMGISSAGRVSVPFALKDVVNEPPDGVTATADLPTDADPQNFPHDTYRFRTLIFLYPPTGIRVRPAGATSLQGDGFAVAAGLAPEATLVDWHLRPSIVLSEPHPSGFTFLELDGHLGRPVSYVLFVYGVALTPLLLMLSFVRHRRNRQAASAADGFAGIEMAAALLALLALRQVLVPETINGLTWLDKILALELVVFSSSVVVLAAAAPSPATRARAAATPDAAAAPPTGNQSPQLAQTALRILIAAWFGMRVLHRIRRRNR